MRNQSARSGYAWLSMVSMMPALALAPPVAAHQAVDPAILDLVLPDRTARSQSVDELIEEGERLFFEETFGGNGRTCGTCHRDDNNYTIDPRFIATLPADDPLFVAEFTPELSELENSRLLRDRGLITENLDGFDEPGVLRGVPHVQGLSQSIEPDRDADSGDPFPLENATGWSGDGAPGTGSLEVFAVGAVVQHFTRTLERRPGIDFRVPTEHELAALLAFQLSVGRQSEIRVDPADAGSIRFLDARAERGRFLFHDAPAVDGGRRACTECHVGAGANDEAGEGGQFSTGVEALANAPACLTGGVAPGDGGFGMAPVTTVPASMVCGYGATFEITFRGNRAFNTPPLIEAADTAPFFHNNSADTLEEAVRFYTTDTFNRSPAGDGRAFVLKRRDITDITAFLRAINVLDNAREAIRLIGDARAKPVAEAGDTILEARSNALDAVEVLAAKPSLFAATNPKLVFAAAARKLNRAAPTADPHLLASAERDLTRVRKLIARNAPEN